MKRPTYEELEKKIADLERRLQALEAKPHESHVHYHHYAPQPVYQPPVPLPSTIPTYPWIGDPVAPPYRITCGATANPVAAAVPLNVPSYNC